MVTKNDKNKIRFSMKRTVKTFTNVSIVEIDKLYSDFLSYIKTLSHKDKVVRLLSTEKGLQANCDRLAKESVANIGSCYTINLLIIEVIKTREALTNNIVVNLNKDMEKYKTSFFEYPDKKEFIKFDGIHGISNNYLYEYSKGNTHISDPYRNWINAFPVMKALVKEYWKVDWNRPVEVFIDYVLKESHDSSNCDKAVLDQILNRIYEVDDKCVTSVHSRKIGTCQNFKDGSIAIYIRNIE